MLTIDQLAHFSHWRRRALAEKGLLAFGMLLLAVALPPFPASLLVIACMLAATFCGARVPPAIWCRYALAPLGFLLTGALTLLIEINAHGVALSPAGVLLAPGLLLRSLAGICCLLFFALTTPVADVLAGMRTLGIPREIVEISLLMYRLVFLTLDTAHAMGIAQAARLGQRSRRQHLRSLGQLLANLLPRALDRARRMETGLAARGWSGELRVLKTRQPISLPHIGLIVLAESIVLAIGVASR